MKKISIKSALFASVAVGAVVVGSVTAQAGGFGIREQSAVGQGASFAGEGTPGMGLSAMFWNPAAVTQATGMWGESHAALMQRHRHACECREPDRRHQAERRADRGGDCRSRDIARSASPSRRCEWRQRGTDRWGDRLLLGLQAQPAMVSRSVGQHALRTDHRHVAGLGGSAAGDAGTDRLHRC